MLCARDTLIPYPRERQGEDTPVVAHLLRHCEVGLLNDPMLYIYIVHARNTWDVSHFERHWELATEQYTGTMYTHMLRALGLTAYVGGEAAAL